MIHDGQKKMVYCHGVQANFPSFKRGISGGYKEETVIQVKFNSFFSVDYQHYDLIYITAILLIYLFGMLDDV